MAKIINFTYVNQNYVELADIEPLLRALFDNLMMIEVKNELNCSQWKFLFEFTHIINNL